jgi:hypothetical protein
VLHRHRAAWRQRLAHDGALLCKLSALFVCTVQAFYAKRAAARGIALECSAILDLMHLQRLAERQLLTEAKSLLVRLVAMLSKMCR